MADAPTEVGVVLLQGSSGALIEYSNRVEFGIVLEYHCFWYVFLWFSEGSWYFHIGQEHIYVFISKQVS